MTRIGNVISKKIYLSVDHVGEGNVGATLCKSFDVVNQKSDSPRYKNNTKDAVYKKFRVSLNFNLTKTLIN